MLKISRVLIILFLSVVVQEKTFGQEKGPFIDGIIAKVDNYIILRSEVEETAQGYIEQFRLPKSEATCEALRSLLLSKVMVAKAEIDSVLVEDDQVERDLNMRMQYYISQFGSQSRLEEHFGKTMDQFKEELRGPLKEQLIANKMRNEITSKIKVTPSEVKRFFNKIPTDSLPLYSREVVVGHIVKVPSIGQGQKNEARKKAIEIRNKILRGTDISANYQDMQIKLGQNNAVSIITPSGTINGIWKYEINNTITFNIDSENPNISRLNQNWLISKNPDNSNEIRMIQSDFDDNTTFILSSEGSASIPNISKNNITRPWRVASAFEGGESFSEMAKLHSDDPGSKENGGNLGFHRRGELVPSYEATAMNLKPGEISQPIESQFGYHVIQLLERRGNEFNSRHILFKFNSSELDIKTSRDYLDSLRTIILKDSITFEKAAKEYSEDKLTASSGGFFVDEETGANIISVDDIDPVLFFTLDTMKVGSISQPMEFRTEQGATAVRIVYFKASTPPHKANLKDDYQKIQVAALNQKRQKALVDWFEDAKKEVYIEINSRYNNCNILDTNSPVSSDAIY